MLYSEQKQPQLRTRGLCRRGGRTRGAGGVGHRNHHDHGHVHDRGIHHLHDHVHELMGRLQKNVWHGGMGAACIAEGSVQHSDFLHHGERRGAR
jgi:hypothetical protein